MKISDEKTDWNRKMKSNRLEQKNFQAGTGEVQKNKSTFGILGKVFLSKVRWWFKSKVL